MKPLNEQIKKKPWLGWVIFISTAVVVFLLGLFASSIVERRAEAVFAYQPGIDIAEFEPRSNTWGENYPRQYESFMNTSDTSFYSKHAGSGMIDMLERHPEMVVLWAGYSFSKDYTQSRGHYYSIKDMRENLRTGAPMEPDEGPMPATCWACKSPDVPRVMAKTGPKDFYNKKWAYRGSEIINPIGCADCHDHETMNLQITRPALIEAFQRQGIEVNKASHQEMRSLVCAQCHVEYYFKKEGDYLTFPWDSGTNVEEMENYYDALQFTDWTHAISKTPMLKAQHPDYEIFKTGIHYQRGVSCADCHMPYISEGGQKFTDHHIQSPLNNINSSCQVCHRESEEELWQNAIDKQDKALQIRTELEKILVRAHVEAGKAWELGATEEEMEPVLQSIRHAQWRWDYAAAGHGSSFHSTIEVSRIIATGIQKAQNARIQLARLLTSKGFDKEIPYPDISTKEKAQEFVNLNMEKLRDEKEKFMKTIVPRWDKEGKERQEEELKDYNL
ncbi:MAG: ammonia-forming cytochrome c nitrite reductase [Bacteroidales bacterium]